MRKLFLVFLFSLTIVVVFAQTYPVPNYGNEPSIQSPNVFQFGKFGEIPVSPFNGTPEIMVPITTVNNGEITVPIRLRYDASGCRPDMHPSIVGLNWSLEAGGVIKRHTNGYFDEYIYTGTKNSYYDKYNELNRPDWSNVSLDLHILNDELAPDEFSFSFNGINGNFMLNHEGKWIVKSKQSISLKIEHEIQEDFALTEPDGVREQKLPRAFTKFTITTNDGTKYVFGGEQSAIEFSRPYIKDWIENYNLRGPRGPGSLLQMTYHEVVRNIQPSAWHLTEIISPYGQHVRFYYTSRFAAQQNTYSDISYRDQKSPSGLWYTYDVNQNMGYLLNSSYLDSIKSDNNIACYFSRSISNELPWIYDGKPLTLLRFATYFPEANRGILIKYYKLDDIKIKVQNQLIKKVSLAYIEKNTERLKLNKVREHSAIDDKIVSEYAFEYNSTMLPVYNSGYEDHWGFFNNQNFWGSHSSVDPVSVPNLSAYYASRAPSETHMKAESLSRMIYPTGGYTDFFFEPHTYSKVIKQKDVLTIDPVGSNLIAGGLRIKRTETYDGQSPTPIIKEYFYNTNYIDGGNISSGILSGEPVYYEEGIGHLNNHFTHFSSAPLNYLNTTDGNHITYSQVTEKSSNGYIVYDYTNHDNGYLDKNPFDRRNGISYYSNHYNKAYGKLELERGLNLSTRYFASDKFLQKEVVNRYNDNPDRYNSFVRVVANLSDSYSSSFNLVSYPLYTFYPFLKTQTTTEYFRTGGSVSTIISYAYDPSSNLLESSSTLNSDGSSMKSTFKYPCDFTPNTGSTQGHIYAEMTLKNMIKYPIVKKTFIDNYVTNVQLTCYNNFGNDRVALIKPNATYKLESSTPIADFEAFTFNSNSSLNIDKRMSQDASFSYYTDGNIKESSLSQKGITSTYIWSYDSQYLVAIIENMTYVQLEGILGQTYISNLKSKLSPTDSDLTPLDNLRNNNSYPNIRVSSFKFLPLIGLCKKTDPRGVTTYYDYDSFNRLKRTYIKENNVEKTVQTYDYHYKQ